MKELSPLNEIQYLHFTATHSLFDFYVTINHHILPLLAFLGASLIRRVLLHPHGTEIRLILRGYLQLLGS